MFTEYHNLIERILVFGTDSLDRTKVGTRSIFGAQLFFDTSIAFPLLTTKKIHFKSVLHELLWFISGDTNIKYLKDNGVNIWNEWADENGDLGPIYGKQWRKWNGVDQLKNVIDSIKDDPFSRRHIVSAWNVSDLPLMKLPPCHNFFQFNVDSKNNLDLMVNMRSCDVFLGLPFNIASYAVLLQIIAQCTNKNKGVLIFNLGNTHIYHNHFEQCDELVNRKEFECPQLKINLEKTNIDDFVYSDFELIGYKSHPAIKAPVAI